jgi:hypothetical protein
MEKPMVGCKDCAYIERQTNGFICTHKKLAEEAPDFYNGTMVLVYPPIQYARTIGECGPDARLFMTEIKD